MSEKEKLIKLIYDEVGGCTKDVAEDIADHLLANGVIVPPVKVGQTLHVIEDRWNAQKILWEKRISEIKVNRIYYDEDGFWIEDIYGYNYYPKCFGKIVFLSKEDAEKALATVTDTNVGSKGVE